MATAVATSPLFRRKYVIASRPNGIRCGPRDAGLRERGARPDVRKKTSPAIQIDKAAAETLNNIREGSRVLLAPAAMMTRISIATVIVPAHVPNSRTEAKTNVSETESLAVIEGSLIVKAPVKRVSTARTSH
jgi:hypothetical protein